MSAICVGLKKLENIYGTFLAGCCLPYCTCCMLSYLVYFDVSFKCLVCIVVSGIVCMVVAVWCILWSSYVYLLYCVY
jgi:ascorbate-specific PTS system EIIC-type component UlaA